MKESKGYIKGTQLISGIKSGKINVDTRPNHGNDFHGAYEKWYREMFHEYLGSCSRYLGNKRYLGY